MRIIGYLETNEMNITTEESEFLLEYFDSTHGRRLGGGVWGVISTGNIFCR